jgi:serine/threonine-protein phosphatase 2A regulatory subunit B''
LKKNPQLAANIFNTLFNLDKYLDHEQRDPFASAGSTAGPLDFSSEGESDWDKYAASEYELLIAEESPSEQL